MLESWLASPAAKLKKQQSEILGNVNVAGIGQLLLSCEAIFRSGGNVSRAHRGTVLTCTF
jgi:hypothetical protein